MGSIHRPTFTVRWLAGRQKEVPGLVSFVVWCGGTALPRHRWTMVGGATPNSLTTKPKIGISYTSEKN